MITIATLAKKISAAVAALEAAIREDERARVFDKLRASIRDKGGPRKRRRRKAGEASVDRVAPLSKRARKALGLPTKLSKTQIAAREEADAWAKDEQRIKNLEAGGKPWHGKTPVLLPRGEPSAPVPAAGFPASVTVKLSGRRKGKARVPAAPPLDADAEFQARQGALREAEAKRHGKRVGKTPAAGQQ